MAMTDEQEASIVKFALAALALLIAFLGYEFFKHQAGFFSGLDQCIISFWHGVITLWGVVAGTIGYTAASVTLLSCVVIPVTTVSVYTIFRKVEDQPKAYIVALGLFLNPLFIDFFRDKIHEDRPLQKLLLGAVGAVTFLIAISLWNKADMIHRKNQTAKALAARVIAIFLFLLPTLCMLGYVAISAHHNSTEFVTQLNVANIIGLVGLLGTAIIGISLSRFFEAP